MFRRAVSAIERDRPHTLQTLLAAGKPLSPERVLALLRAAARSVDQWHARSGFHGTVTPSAFLLSSEGTVTLLAPGALESLDGDPAGVDRLDGQRYWSPQRRAGEVPGFADDLYALGQLAQALFALVALDAACAARVEKVLRAQRGWSLSARYASGAELVRELANAVVPPTEPGRTLSNEAASGAATRWHDGQPRYRARRVAPGAVAHRLTLTERPDASLRERAQQIEVVHHPIRHRHYPHLSLPGGWVVAVVAILCSVYLFPLYYMLFAHG